MRPCKMKTSAEFPFLVLFFTSHALFLARQVLQPACSPLTVPNETNLIAGKTQICSYSPAVPWADTTRSWFRSKFCLCKSMLRGVTAFILTGECPSIKHLVSNLLGHMPKVKKHTLISRVARGLLGVWCHSKFSKRKTWKSDPASSSHHSSLWDLLRNREKKKMYQVVKCSFYLPFDTQLHGLWVVKSFIQAHLY